MQRWLPLGLAVFLGASRDHMVKMPGISPIGKRVLVIPTVATGQQIPLDPKESNFPSSKIFQ